MAEMLNGKMVVTDLSRGLSEQTEALKQKGIAPCLATVRIGDKKSDISYERGAVKRCESIGVEVRQLRFEENIHQEELEAQIIELNNDKSVHGILMFRPLPDHLDEQKLCDLLSVEKDVDGATKGSMAGVFMDQNAGFPPCTAEACMEVLKYYGIDVAGKHVAVVGRSLVVGKPLSMLLLKKNATVTVCHSRTKDMSSVCSRADILIVAVGKAEMVQKDYVSAGQTVIDVGINVNQVGNLCGDVAYDEVSEIVSAITPVPGGIGTVTSSILAAHTIQAAIRQDGERGGK